MKLRVLSVLSCMAAFLAVAPLAQAGTISGTVYINQAPFTGNPLALPPYTGTHATFNVNQLDFTANAGPGYTIANFLTSNGSVLSNKSANFATVNAANPGDGLDNTIFDFKGSSYLSAGTYTVRHDDGAYLFLNGVMTNVLTPGNSGIPTAAEDSFFTIATGGNYSFELAYTEVNGPPAVLNAPFASTPEPSSFILLGSGLFAAAGVIRRRLMA